MIQAKRKRQTLEILSLRPTQDIERAVEVVQFGDYECRECGLAAEMLQAFRHHNDRASWRKEYSSVLR